MRKVISGIAICAMTFSVSAKDVDAEQVVQDSLFDGIYAGLGIGGSFLKTTGGIPENGFNLSEELEADRFTGSVVVGVGKVINKVYGGFEILLDISKNKKSSKFIDLYQANDSKSHDGSAYIDMKGYIPQINLKAGYSFSHDTIVYGKVGCSWSKLSSSFTHPEVAAGGAGESAYDKTPATSGTSSKTKASIILGVGAEKIFSNRFSTSLEVDYNFGATAKGTETTDTNETTEKTLHWTKGWSIRALAKYNVRI